MKKILLFILFICSAYTGICGTSIAVTDVGCISTNGSGTTTVTMSYNKNWTVYGYILMPDGSYYGPMTPISITPTGGSSWTDTYVLPAGLPTDRCFEFYPIVASPSTPADLFDHFTICPCPQPLTRCYTVDASGNILVTMSFSDFVHAHFGDLYLWVQAGPGEFGGPYVAEISPAGINWTYSYVIPAGTVAGTGCITGYIYQHASGPSGSSDPSEGWAALTPICPCYCNANFSYSVSSTMGLVVTFFPDTYDPLSTYTWSFGDFGSASGPGFSHIYPGPGSYSACLTIRRPDGTVCSKCMDVCISGTGPGGGGGISSPGSTGKMTRPSPLSDITLYPNPSSNMSQLSFQLAEERQVTVEILDITGRVIRTASNQVLSAGSQKVQVNTADLAAGTYQVRVQSEELMYVLPLSVVK